MGSEGGKATAAVLSVCWEGLVLTYRGRSDLTASEA